MKYFLAFLLIFSAACASNKTKQNSPISTAMNALNLSELKLSAIESPGKSHIDATVYIESVKAGLVEGKPSLLIQGNFSNGCAYLAGATIKVEEGYVVELSSKYPDQMVCTQALVPFNYLFSDLNADLLKSGKDVRINGTAYTIN